MRLLFPLRPIAVTELKKAYKNYSNQISLYNLATSTIIILLKVTLKHKEVFPRRHQMFILQDLARILQKMVILQDLARRWLSCEILARRIVILQDLARIWKKILQDDVSSCKILQKSCKILQDNHSDPTRVVLEFSVFKL